MYIPKLITFSEENSYSFSQAYKKFKRKSFLLLANIIFFVFLMGVNLALHFEIDIFVTAFILVFTAIIVITIHGMLMNFAEFIDTRLND